MKLAAATLVALFFAAFLCLSVPLRALGQKAGKWTWKDAKGNVRSRADLDKILAQHELWLDSFEASGARADLGGANLTGADLTGAHLIGAQLSGTDLSGADLTGAWLSNADLTGAWLRGSHLKSADLTSADLTAGHLSGADLSHAFLHDAQLIGVDLTDAQLMGAYLLHADLSDARLKDANLDGALLERADLAGADLTDATLGRADLGAANLTYADLTDATLGGADLGAANLTRTILTGTDLTGADLTNADLEEAAFEPKSLPVLESVALARHLELMKFGHYPQWPFPNGLDTSIERPPEWWNIERGNPGPLTQLRKQFQDEGYREQERAITCALNRRGAELDSPIERWFKRIAFDWTCQYGLTPGRPLLIVFALWLLCSGVYAWFMRRPGPSGIYFVGCRLWRGKSNTQGVRIRRRTIHATKKWKTPFLWLREEWRLRRAALFFSLMSAFNIGFRDINFGRWLRLLTRREYDLKAVGWARTVSGFQSLLSVYLIALWVLTYFGRPFG